ncbi:hypothetical protein DNHGIG_18540 [Collibacillus ludicampi]|jgi:hypothetical protein|uniref:DUF2642 domain-containing protein n=1 Tax=Collibacillus ludicampi TaxID=2771369 RepID=A0AAV4LET9_9BACL|nr:DUF2642 domain-containing protein [Collibacillus ludicampi]GIM46305.1 hypothetical protein DNHGIG_18540 [Collibacillus ludicampi]
MNDLQQWIGKQMNIEISGKKRCKGILIDFGSDIVVIYDGQQFLYIPLVHIQHMELSLPTDEIIENPNHVPFDKLGESFSYRKMLDHAKGRFVEIYVTGNKSIHGYLTNLMNDYFVFYSPIYKTMYISLYHLKWLIPHSSQVLPYSLSTQSVPLNPSLASLPQIMKDLCKKLEGKLVIFDLGDHPHKTGLLNRFDPNNHLIEMVIANGETIYWNFQHLKTLSLCD